MSDITDRVDAVYDRLTPEEKEEFDALLKPSDAPAHAWTPQQGPQTIALDSKADVLLYGGAAGGGKSDLALGAALTEHSRSIIYRREGTQTVALIDRLAEILGTRVGFNSQSGVWRLPRRSNGTTLQIEFGSCPNPGNETRYQGRPHDLIVFDEVVHFREKQVRFLMGWNRTTLPGQRVRVIMTSNPPTPENAGNETTGLWIIRMFAPWLDPAHPRPAQPGELRWYAHDPVTGEERELSDDPEDPYYHNEGLPFWLPHQDPDNPDDMPLLPMSRTFIPAKVTDNQYLRDTNYVTQLQALPEPLRSQMLHGDFAASLADNPQQVYPTAWVRAAIDRRKQYAADHPGAPEPRTTPMTSLGLDVSRGGRDQTVLARRHGWWYDDLVCIPGSQVPDGPTAAGQALGYQRNDAEIIVDAIGIGASAYDHLVGAIVNATAHVGSERATRRDRSGRLTFMNKRSEAYWRLREALDPATAANVCLPDDDGLLEEMLSVTWSLSARGIQVIPKKDLAAILGRSPDKVDAVVMAATFDSPEHDNPTVLYSTTSRAATLPKDHPAARDDLFTRNYANWNEQIRYPT